MENNKKNKFKVFMILFVLLVLIAGSSYAVWRYNYNGTSSNVISSTDLSFRFLESNNEIVSIDNAVPMSDDDGIKQEGTGNVFDFEVKSKVGATTDVKYVASLEKISVDSDKTALNDSDVKVYIEDFNGNTVLKPTKVSDLDGYKLFEKLHRHSKDNSEISTKYKLKVWLDSEVDVFSLENKQYKFKINVKTEQKEQDSNQSYKLVYDLDGGTGSIADSTFKVGESVTITSVVPTKEGYNFLGWSTKKNDSSVKYKAGDNVTFNDAYDGSVRLYAVWEQNITYTVKYNPNGGFLNIGFTSTTSNYVWEEISGVYRSGNYNVNSSTSTMKSDEFILTESGDISFDWAVSSESASYDYLYYTIYKDGTALSDTGTSTKIGGNYSITDESNLTYTKVTKTLEAGTYYIEFSYRKDSSTHKGLDRGYVKNLIIPGYGEDKIMDDSTFGSGINKLSKNKYKRDHYTFKGWSLSKDATSATYQDEQEVGSLTNKNNDIVNLYAVWEINKYTVNVVVQNGTVDTATKQIEYNKNGIFNLTTDVEGAIGSVTCTNNQIGKVENNILTVSNVNADTDCTVSFKDTFTTLYEDGTLIINESAKNRNTNLSAHGNITKEYEPMSDSNSYVMNNQYYQLWENERSSIKNVEIGQKIEPISTQYWFYGLINMEKGDFSNLDTSSVTDMDRMFYNAGQSATAWNIGDISNWNVSNVTDMSSMFSSAGYSATTWNIGDLSKWDTSKVTRMDSMFEQAGYKAETFNLDLSNWDTSKVTSMSRMFTKAGYKSTEFTIEGLSNWNVSKVTNMNYMFYYAGNDSTTFNLNLSGWDTSSVTNMGFMFVCAGYKTKTWNIGDISNWNVSNVTDMSEMFSSAGYSATTFNLNLSNWNTSSVTNMRAMFDSAGYSATTWSIGDLSNWDTSSVTVMSSMFGSAGNSATTWSLGDLSKWNTSSVTDMSYMFTKAGYKSTEFTIEGLSNWDVSKVTKMNYMFDSAGYNSTTFNLNLSNWNTSSITNMSYMFKFAGQNSTTFNLNLSNWNTSSVTNMSYMFNGAGYNAITFNLNLSNWNTSKATDMSTMFWSAGYNATTWLVTIPKTTGSLTNTTSKWYGSSDSVYAEPSSGKSFTIPSDVSVIVQDGTLADGESATKTGWTGRNTTFNIVPNDSSKTAIVSCTNNQTGTFKDNVLTVSNVTSDTTCTVTFDSVSTVLYNDGTLIINELSSHRSSNIATHGSVTKEYDAYSNSNAYVFSWSGAQPWNSMNSSIKSVIVDQKIKPSSMDYWFGVLPSLESGEFSNIDTSEVTSMKGLFSSYGYVQVDSYVLNGLENWDTSNVTDMSGMFSTIAPTVTSFSLDLSKWNMSKVTNMESMFLSTATNAKTWMVKIPKRTGSLTNTVSSLYGSSDSVYAEPPSGKSFTLAT